MGKKLFNFNSITSLLWKSFGKLIIEIAIDFENKQKTKRENIIFMCSIIFYCLLFLSIFI